MPLTDTSGDMTAGQSLATHTSDSGHGWVDVDGGSGDIVAVGTTGRVRGSGANAEAFYTSTFVAPSADQFVESIISPLANITAKSSFLLVGMQGSTTDKIRVNFGYDISLRKWAIYIIQSNGTAALTVTGPDTDVPVPTDTYTQRLTRVGTTYTGTVNGEEVVTATNGTITRAGSPTLYTYQNPDLTDSDGFQLDYISTAEPVTPPNPQVFLASSAIVRNGLSKSNWYYDATNSRLVAVNEGADARYNVSSTTSVIIGVDTTALAGLSPTAYPKIAYRKNSGAWTRVTLSEGQTQVVIPITVATLLEIVFDARDIYQQTWGVSGGRAWPRTALVITGFTVDEGATFTAATRLADWMLWYGDSNSGANFMLGASGSQTTSVQYGQASTGYVRQAAVLLGVEPSIVAFAGTGWIRIWSEGVADVPAFPATRNSLFSGKARAFSPVPKYIVIDHGTNDTVDVQSVVLAQIAAIRADWGATPVIVVKVPLNQTHKAQIIAAVASYKSANPGDGKVFLLDLGALSLTYTDSIHLTQGDADTVSPLIADAIEAFVPVVPDTTPPTLASLSIPSAGTTITGTLSESGCLPASGVGGFTLPGTTRTVTSWSISGTTWTGALSGVVYGSQTPLLTYNRATTADDIRDGATTPNYLANFTGAAVTNNSTQTAPVDPDPGGSTYPEYNNEDLKFSIANLATLKKQFYVSGVEIYSVLISGIGLGFPFNFLNNATPRLAMTPVSQTSPPDKESLITADLRPVSGMVECRWLIGDSSTEEIPEIVLSAGTYKPWLLLDYGIEDTWVSLPPITLIGEGV